MNGAKIKQTIPEKDEKSLTHCPIKNRDRTEDTRGDEIHHKKYFLKIVHKFIT
jgi:hypothetical protein